MKKLISLILLSTLLTFAQSEKTFDEICKETEKISEQYLKLYFDLDFENLGKLMHKDNSFQDPTAELIFGGSLVSGKSNMVNYFKTNYASLEPGGKVNLDRKIFSGNTAVFEGKISWSFKNREKKLISIKDMPFLMVLETKDGLVSKHRDYGDYRIFLEQYKTQK